MFLLYRKKLKHNLLQEEKTQADIARLHEVPDIIEGTSNLLLSEPSTPNQTDQGVRMFTYPISRRRLSSSGSINSTTPLLKNRSGSHRSRFSSGVSSRIDSNIAEGGYIQILLATQCVAFCWLSFVIRPIYATRRKYLIWVLTVYVIALELRTYTILSNCRKLPFRDAHYSIHNNISISSWQSSTNYPVMRSGKLTDLC